MRSARDKAGTLRSGAPCRRVARGCSARARGLRSRERPRGSRPIRGSPGDRCLAGGPLRPRWGGSGREREKSRRGGGPIKPNRIMTGNQRGTPLGRAQSIPRNQAHRAGSGIVSQKSILSYYKIRVFADLRPTRTGNGMRQQAHGNREGDRAAIREAGQRCADIGTALVVALFLDHFMTVAHSGDSRLYRLRGESMEQVARDHSLLQEQLDSGLITPEEAKLSQNKNLVTRALGIDPSVEPEVHVYETQPEDTSLLCSDALRRMLQYQ